MIVDNYFRLGGDPNDGPVVIGADSESTLFCGDCRDILLSEMVLSFDTVVTDIPYGEASDAKRGGGREKYRGQLREVGKGGENHRTIQDKDMVRILLNSNANSYYVFCSTEQAGVLRAGFQEAGLSTRTGVWLKSNPSPANGQHLWTNALEMLVFARMPKSFFHEKYRCKAPFWNYPVVHGKSRLVKTQKPVSMIAGMIEASTPPGGAVLDPFCGSGTTMEAARSIGMKSVGIEYDMGRASKAKERLWG